MLVLVTGGSGSGKSFYAEERILSFGEKKRIYIATMFPFDQECEKRIARHRDMRAGKGFETMECYTGLKNLSLPKNCAVLLECMSNLTANEMFQENGAHENTVEEIKLGILKLLNEAEDVVIVTNEIFSEAERYEESTREYQKYLGMINQAAAELADEVVEVVYGIPVFHKKRKMKDEKFVE